MSKQKIFLRIGLLFIAFSSAAKVDTKLSDADFFAALDLSRPELKSVARALENDDFSKARKALCSHYRQRTGDFWWKDLYPSIFDDRSISKDRKILGNIRNRTGAFGSSHWNADGSFDWAGMSKTNMLQRTYFFSNLAELYAAEPNGEPVETWTAIFRDWVAQLPLDPKAPAWYTMNVGIRLRTGWGDAFTAFVRAPELDDETLFLFLKSYYEQAAFLRDNHSKTSNWLTFEMAGLYSAGVLFPEFKAAEDWRKHAAETALNNLDDGWLPDGMSIELTPEYGKFFINYLKIYELAKQTGQHDPAVRELVQRCERLFTPYVQIVAPDGFAPAFNDNHPCDCRAFIRDEALRYFPSRPDFQWLATDGRKGEQPDYTSFAFPYAGYLVIRSGWETNANYLCFDAGPLGYRHAHQDKLGMVLWAYGRQILFDPGREAYTDSPHQNYCIDTFSHSTGLVDNRPQRRVWYKDPNPAVEPFHPATDFDCEIQSGSVWGRGVYSGHYGRKGSMGTDAYPYKKGGNFKQDWCRPASHERQVAWLAPDIFVVQDIFRPTDDQSHRYEIRWQLDSLEWKQYKNWGETEDAGQPNLAVVPIEATGLRVETASAEDDPEILGWKVKDKSYPSTTLRHIREGRGERGFLTLLLPLEAGRKANGFTGRREADGSFSIVLNDGRRLRISPATGQDGRLVLTEK